jgi:cell division protease FtsH
MGLFVLWLLCSATVSNGFSFTRNTKFNFNPNHLDSHNIDKLEKLEKMFYLKNRRYSPFQNKYNTNITEPGQRQNITKIFENINNEFIKILEQQQEDVKKDEETIINSFDDFKNVIGREDDESLFGRRSADSQQPVDDDYTHPLNGPNSEFGFMDSTGVFRYKDPKIFSKRTGNGHRQTKSNNAESSDSDCPFQIIKNSEYSFNDVGGYGKIKEELLQSADILINYEKYQKYNVRTPKGMIFEGPPGNGKTLMAKGFSGELNISFIPVSGSEFSEKYVGVGALRVRELFKLAEENRPCIIFIDEIDAVARKRGNDAVSSNSEKDQTLNQLLISLDGFKHSNGIFVIGATNRVDLLDAALIRPGRMDKNIFIGNPDSETRKAILQIHSEGKPIDSSITMDSLVEMTGGFSGAQIENLLNESMLKALRDNREIITHDDLEYIINRIMSGWQSTESKYSDDIIQRIAIHEMGHAVAGFFSEFHPKLTKIALNLWSPKSPGFTLFESNDENVNIYTKNGLFSHLVVLLGGRIAEELFFGYSVTTGAKKDLEEAYKLAQNMILQYGMGKQNIYPDLSDQSKYLIDQEVNNLLLLARDAAADIISNSKEYIVTCAEILKKDHILKPEHMLKIAREQYPSLLARYDVTRYVVEELSGGVE